MTDHDRTSEQAESPLLTDLKAARDADVKSRYGGPLMVKGAVRATWGDAISIAERHLDPGPLVVVVNGLDWPVEPYQLHDAIEAKVAELVPERGNRQEIVDMAWSLVHHVGLRVPPAGVRS